MLDGLRIITDPAWLLAIGSRSESGRAGVQGVPWNITSSLISQQFLVLFANDSLLFSFHIF